MSTFYIQSETLENIADAIREKGGTSEAMTAAQMGSKIRDIEVKSDIPPHAYEGGSITEFSSPANYVLNSAFCDCYSLISINLPNVSYIGDYAFQYCISLTSVNLSNVSYIGRYAFNHCPALVSINLPNVSYIGNCAFFECSSLTSMDLPNVNCVEDLTFKYCESLAIVSLPKVSCIKNGAFMHCYNLLSLYLLSNSVCSLPYSNAFTHTPIAGYTTSTGGAYGSIYVPASLYNSYKTATDWSVYSSRFVSV